MSSSIIIKGTTYGTVHHKLPELPGELTEEEMTAWLLGTKFKLGVVNYHVVDQSGAFKTLSSIYLGELGRDENGRRVFVVRRLLADKWEDNVPINNEYTSGRYMDVYVCYGPPASKKIPEGAWLRIKSGRR